MPGKSTYDKEIRAAMNDVIHATLKTQHEPLDMTYAPLDFPNEVQLPKPKYPEINPTYPGPFLRDPGELDPWDERYGV